MLRESMTPNLTQDPDRAFLGSLTVLYAEDDPGIREQLARFLRRRVGRLLEARDGLEGLELFRAERPALVITDIQMPRLDGLSMAEEIRRLDNAVPIVVTTAFEQVDYLRRSIDAAIDRYVTKPIDAEKLEAALWSCARRLRAERLFLQEHQRELERLRSHEREAIGLLAGGMAHDFNNLLQAILGAIDGARELAAAGTEQRELLDLGMDATLRAAELGHRLLTLSEGWFAHLRPESVAPSLHRAVAEALAGSGTRVTLELADDLPLVLHDGELLQRALAHLARNAREAMAGGGTLTVEGRVRDLAPGEQGGELQDLAAGAYLQLEFRDTGHGIAPEHLARIFDPYFSTKSRGAIRGMGLGLALARAILRKHRGWITARSAPGEGAVFTVLLPCGPSRPAADVAPPATPAQQPAVEEGPGTYRILERLKEGTRASHLAIERVVPLLRPGLTGQLYRYYLARLLGFYEPMETLLGAQPWRAAGFDYEPRRKTGLLVADLEFLGLGAHSRTLLPRAADLPRIAGLPEAFGCAYVFEGATRGGRVMARHLGGQLGLGREHGCGFFLAYGEEGEAMWAAFRASLEAYIREPAAGDRVVGAAQQTFALLQRWLERGTGGPATAHADA